MAPTWKQRCVETSCVESHSQETQQGSFLFSSFRRYETGKSTLISCYNGDSVVATVLAKNTNFISFAFGEIRAQC